MGYVPPTKPLPDHIVMSQETLVTISRVYDIGNQFLHAYGGSRKTGYQRYIEDLYGGRTAGLFPILNYGLLASMVALVVLVLWAIR